MDPDLIRLNEIDRRIADIRRQLSDHELEVQDVLACVDTPESSDVEGEEVDEPEVADSRGELCSGFDSNGCCMAQLSQPQQFLIECQTITIQP